MWDKPPSLFGDVVEKAAVKRVKDISSDLFPALVYGSPEDTSRYLSNHNVSLNTPSWSHDDNKMIGKAGSVSVGMAVIKGMAQDRLQDVWITNTISYAGDLEQGKSRTAPDGVYLPTFLAVAMYYR